MTKIISLQNGYFYIHKPIIDYSEQNINVNI